MTRILLTFVMLTSACSTAVSTPSASASATEAATTSALASPTVAATIAPIATPTQRPEVAAPDVVVRPGTFPVLTSLRLKLAVIDDAVVQATRGGVEQYLRAIDYYRNHQTPALPISGRFLAAVAAALKDSATPGVTREFALESLRVDRHVQKPWGTHAYVDVTVTIVDRAVGGTAPDQRETGMLRLSGDRLRVTDGWDQENGRWFNGFGPLPLDEIPRQLGAPVSEYLRGESWTLTTAPSAWTFGGEVSTFARARAERVAAIDHAQIVSRVFEGTTATIERFDTIDGIWSGLATVLLAGMLVTTNAAGRTDRVPFERRVRVFLFGSWVPEVVDEQAPSGAWVSGDELALDKIDVDRA
jgi:hypothetical protein